MAYFRNVTLNIEDFDTEEDYSRALLEQERIQKILSNVDITDAHVARQLYEGFNQHPEMFRSIVGTEFMDVLRENSKDDNIPVEPFVNEQSEDTQDEEMVDTLTPELMKEEQAQELQNSQEIEAQEEPQSLQESEAQALWESTEDVSEPEESKAQEEPQSLQESEAQALWESTEDVSEPEESKAQEEPQSLQESEAQALWESTEDVSEPEESKAQEEPQSLQKSEVQEEPQSLKEIEESTLLQQEQAATIEDKISKEVQPTVDNPKKEESSIKQQTSNNVNNSDNYIADKTEAEAVAIKEEAELMKPEPLKMEKPQILKKKNAIDENKNINPSGQADKEVSKENVNKKTNNKTSTKPVKKAKVERAELTYIGLIKWVIFISPFIMICFPMAGAILSGICALYAFIKVWGAYINDKMKTVDILKSLICVVLLPIGIIISIFGIMKKIKYVYYNRKAILYGFIIYLIPVVFFCNVGLISSNNMVSLIFPIVTLFLNASLVGQIAIILDVMAVVIIIICVASSFTKKVANVIYDYMDKGMTQTQAIQFIICLPIVVLCMFKAFIDGKVLHEDKIVK